MTTSNGHKHEPGLRTVNFGAGPAQLPYEVRR